MKDDHTISASRAFSALGALTFILVALFGTAAPARGQGALGGPKDLHTYATVHDFKTLVGRLEAAVTANGMIQLSKASTSAGAAARGVTIPGDAVVFVFRNDFVVRMLRANVAAGIEAPIPIHVFETPENRASVAYVRPTALFKPYGNGDLDKMAGELDEIFHRIVTTAAQAQTEASR